MLILTNLLKAAMTKPSNSNGNLSKTDNHDDGFGNGSSDSSVTNQEESVCL
jgi:hypothetical protein